MPGPAPKHPTQRRRRNPDTFKGGILTPLPSSGRKGSPPDWPMDDPMSPTEEKVWNDLWHTPQAVAWEQLGWVRVVARYVRDLMEAEAPRAPVTIKAEVRQAEDRLGLTPLALLRLRWEIRDDIDVEKRTGAGAKVRRLRAVEAT